jgi:uncharacterized protein (DUF58 family)
MIAALRRKPPRAEPVPAPPDETDPHATRPLREAERVLNRVDWTVVRRLDGVLQGEYRSLFFGHGLDLAEVREYQPEDDIRYMDWNVTARTGTPHVRQYLEDREITAWLLLDVSGSVDFGTARMTKHQVVTDFAAAMARLLTRRGNRVGAIVYSGGVDSVLPARGGREQALAIVHQLTRPDRPAGGGVTDLRTVLDRAAGSMRRRSLVFVVSDFIAPEGWESALHRLSLRHEVVAVWVQDPRESDLPDVGSLVLEDAETGEQIWIDTHDAGLRARFQELARERRAALSRTFTRHGVDLLTLSTDDDLLRELSRFALRRRAAGPRMARALATRG